MTFNSNAGEELLRRISLEPAPPWIWIREHLQEIEKARERGLTHRRLAAETGISESAWYRGLRRARAWARKQEQLAARTSNAVSREPEGSGLPAGMKPAPSGKNLPFT